MGDSLDSNNLEQNSDDHSASIVEISTFLSYLKRVITLLLQEENEDFSDELTAALEDRAHLECIKKFISDSQVSSLFIQRSSTKGSHSVVHSVIV